MNREFKLVMLAMLTLLIAAYVAKLVVEWLA